MRMKKTLVTIIPGQRFSMPFFRLVVLVILVGHFSSMSVVDNVAAAGQPADGDSDRNRDLEVLETEIVDGIEVPKVADGELPPKNRTILYGRENSTRYLIKVKDGDEEWDEFIGRAVDSYSTDGTILTGIRSKSICAIRVSTNDNEDDTYNELVADPLVEIIEEDPQVATFDMNNYRIVHPDQLSSVDPKLASPSSSSRNRNIETDNRRRMNSDDNAEFNKKHGHISSIGSSSRKTRDLQQIRQGGFNREDIGEGGETIPYGIALIQADLLWDVKQTNEIVQLCVVDTGYNLGHDDLPIGPSFVDGTSTEAGIWPVDGHGHGTHTSGTVAAVGGNDIGVVGVRKNPLVQLIHAGRGMDDDGEGFASTILAAVQGCADAGAKVISMSLGGSASTQVEEKFYQDIYNQDILVVASAGNDGDTGFLYPAGYPTVMSVAAIDVNSVRPGFSQCNSQVEISAPGVDVLSTYPTNTFAFSSGTSQACPHVAAVAAELLAIFPECRASQIRNVLLRTAKPIGEAQGCNNGYGSGLVQALAAHDLLKAEGCEAGGPALIRPSVEAVGGCEQNPDYEAEENPNRDQCPGGAINAFLFSWILVVTTMVGLSSTMLWNI